MSIINRGGFGRVEKVIDNKGITVAQKTFDPLHTYQPNEREKLEKRFRLEVKTQALLKEKFFLPVLESNLEGNNLWFTMPLADKNFDQEIAECKAKGIIPVQGLADILNALEFLHQLGYVHRDLKPANVLYYKELWTLSDFGLVRKPDGQTTILTSEDSSWGTQLYSAPEQIHQFHNVTCTTDIYSFGCILHDIFGNGVRTPYQRHTALGKIGAIIEKCTATKSEQRFQDVQTLRTSLLTLLSENPSINPTPQVAEWVEELKSIQTWDKEKLEDFVRFFQVEKTTGIGLLMREISPDILTWFYNIDPFLFREVALVYIAWAEGNTFDFEYCDVVVSRLMKIWDFGDVEIKTMAILATAKLAYWHNRWFVMKKLFSMCNHQLHDNVAHRVSIEIQVRNAKDWFTGCAQVIGFDISSYHPRIASIINP